MVFSRSHRPSKILDLKVFIIIAPEYNGVVPPVLYNAMWYGHQDQQKIGETFTEKTVGLATHSGGGGTKGLKVMRMMFQHLGVNVIAREILTTYDKPLNEETANNMIIQLIKLS